MNMKEKLHQEIDALSDDLRALSQRLYDHPETAFQEHQACAWLSEYLEQQGFQVDRGAGGVDTAFYARIPGHKRAPTVALLAEYDALPKIGHGCGHNLIAAASLGAGMVLKQILGYEAGGLAIVGTPAEEGGGGKVRLAEAGVFDGMDAAMMFHPGHLNIPGKDMLGRIKFKMEFFGRTAHASGSPDRGINALDAMVQVLPA